MIEQQRHPEQKQETKDFSQESFSGLRDRSEGATDQRLEQHETADLSQESFSGLRDRTETSADQNTVGSKSEVDNVMQQPMEGPAMPSDNSDSSERAEGLADISGPQIDRAEEQRKLQPG